MIKEKTFKKRISALFLMLVVVLHFILTIFTMTASAEGTIEEITRRTDALEDLQKDPDFNPDDYPADANYRILDVIHIAEGVNRELFVYVYNPSALAYGYKAAYVNISFENPCDRDIKYQLFHLTWINSNGVFDKYTLDNFTVSDDEYRYYCISAVYREYDQAVDTIPPSSSVDTIQYRSFGVGQYWRVNWYNDQLLYECKEMDVVDIDIQASGSLRYPEGVDFNTLFVDQKTDSHYVAFSVENYDVEQIYDADITYKIETYSYYEQYSPSYNYKEDLSKTVQIERDYLSSKEVGSNDGSGWFGKKYSWYRIQSVDDFIEQASDDLNHSFSEAELGGLNKSEFVFRFAETSYSETWASDGSAKFGVYSKIEDFGVLRLHFLSDGKTYNLGCVSDLVGTDIFPELEGDLSTNVENTLEEILAILKSENPLVPLIYLIIFLLILSVFLEPVKSFFKHVYKGIKTIIKDLWSIITLPFTLIRQARSSGSAKRKRKRKRR